MSNRSLINIDGEFSLRPPDVAQETLIYSLPYKRSFVGSLFLGGFLAAFSSPFFFVGDMAGGPDGSLFALVTFMFSAFWMLAWSVDVALIAMLFQEPCLDVSACLLRQDGWSYGWSYLVLDLPRHFGAISSGNCSE